MDRATVPEAVDVAKGIDDTVTVLRSKARDKSATIEVHIDSDLPKALGFIGQLNQIWANLLDNALDAIPASGHIDVRATRERQHVVVRITDNGSGIPEEIRDRVFDPFFTTKKDKGTGLGLDFVRRLIRNNDGDVSFESKPGRTEFRVALPAVTTDGGAKS
jgi:signal transduction histidine kinase